jgi:DNA-nicking Smr family endonuclease
LKNKNNDFIYDVKIDLHGLTTMQAFHKVLSTIENSYKAGQRNLVFITGIGNPILGRGLIRAEFPTYIDHPSIREMVLESKYESGKYLVRLRKNKNAA